MKKYIDLFCRYFTGGLLIFSGLVKLNDPIGTQIKMEEYFEVFADDFGAFFHHFVPWALEIGFFMIILEIVLGIAILFFWRMNLTAWITLLMMLFFTFLTFYSAYFNKVTDCGCFGDFVKLTPWTSFLKDLVLDVLIFHLFWYRKTYAAAMKDPAGTMLVGCSAALCLALGVHAMWHLPYIDFRPYKTGNNIPDEMKPRELPKVEYLFKNKKDGKEISSAKFLSDTTTYKYLSSRVVNEAAMKPPITDFAVVDPQGADITEQMFTGIKLFIIVYDVGLASKSNMDKIRSLIASLEINKNIEPIILTASSAEEAEAFRHEQQLPAPYHFCDKTVLKTILRSNPGIALWKNGTVLANWHHNDTPEIHEVLALAEKP